MVGKSWTDDPRRVLKYRVYNLCIGDRARFSGITIRRIGHHTYTLARQPWMVRAESTEEAIKLAWSHRSRAFPKKKQVRS